MALGKQLKTFINAPSSFVKEMIEGVALANSRTLHWIPQYNILHRVDRPQNDRVSVIQGSGSGHEPTHIMLVGRGMLDAACPGDVFAAPPADYVLKCTELMSSPRGVLHIINNYQGDRMCWDMAREMIEAQGIKVGVVLVDDDVAVNDSTYTVGRRGVAGNFFVIKACGAAAERGADLNELVALGHRVNRVVRTMGVALTSCTPPARGKPIFEIGNDEMEIGVGIHGEPGRRREKIKTADAIVDEIFEAVATDLPFKRGDRVGLMINGLGGTPVSELYILFRRAALKCRDHGFQIARSYVGNYCTSLDMAGASLTLIRLDDELVSLLEAPAETAIRIY